MSGPPYRVSRLFGQLVVMRHWTVGDDCAIAGAATLPTARPAAAFFRNDLRFIELPSRNGAAILALIQPRTEAGELHQAHAHLVAVRGVGLALDIFGEILQRRAVA